MFSGEELCRVGPRLVCRPRTLAVLLACALIAVSAPAAGDERCAVEGAYIDVSPAVAMAAKTGVVRCERIDDRKPVSEFFYEEGRLIAQRAWNDLGQRLDTQFHANGAVRSRLREVVYHGRPAWDREDFWPNGLLRLRGTYLPGGRPQGLVQVFHEQGPIETESWYDDGRLKRKKNYALDGRQTLDEEYMPDGTVSSTMRRF